MRIVLSWEEFEMMELLFIHMKENRQQKEKGTMKGEDYEITWNPQVIIVELQAKAVIEKVLLSSDDLEGSLG